MIRRGLGAALLAALAIVSADAQIIQPGTPPNVFIQTQENTTLLGTQNKDKVEITGGTINGTPIGSITPSTGAFTNLTLTGGTITGNVSITGTLGVTGATTLGSLTAGTTSLGATSASSLALTSPLAVTSGGTGLATLTNHAILLGAGTSAVNPLAVGSNGSILIGNTGADPSFSSSPTISGAVSIGSLTLGSPLPVASGGLGIAPTTTPAGSILAFSSTGVIAPTAALMAGQVLLGQGTAALPVPKTLFGDSTLDATGKMVNTAVNGVTYPASPNANTVPVVTFNDGRGTVRATYQQVPNAALAIMAATTIKLNNSASPATPIDGTPAQLGAILCPVNRQVLTSGTTYTTPKCGTALPVRISVRGCGPSAGGAGSGTTPGTVSTPSSDTTWSSPALTAGKGGIPSAQQGGTGGAASGGDINFPGQTGASVVGSTALVGGVGGSNGFGGPGGNGALAGAVAGNDAPALGGGGQGASAGGTPNPGGGGGGGGCLEKDIIASSTVTIASFYTYAIGTGSAGGTAGGSGAAGGLGANGWLDVRAYWQ